MGLPTLVRVGPIWPAPISAAEFLPPGDPESWRILPDWESIEVLAWSSRSAAWHRVTYRHEEDYGDSWYMPEWGELTDVTHWLPFPPPPGEQDGNG